MPRNFKELQTKMYAKMSPAEITAHKKGVAQSILKVRLGQMRKVRELSQVALAEELGTDQGSISRMEKQGDMYLSTLRSYVEAAGGKLELHAIFPEETMTLEIGE